MILKFEEIEKKYIDGVNVKVDLGTFVDAWMIVKKKKGTRADVGSMLNMSIIEVQITEDKIRGFKVNLPDLRVST